MPHPGNDGGFGTLLDGDAFGPGDGAAANRGGMVHNFPCNLPGEIGVPWVEVQGLDDRPVEILDIFGLGLVPASCVSLPAFGIGIGGSLDFEFGTDLLDGRCRCPKRLWTKSSCPSFPG